MKIPRSQYWGLLIDYLKPEWSRFLLMILFLFSSIGLQLINPLIVRHFIDTARSTEALQKLIQAGLLFIGVGLIHQAVSAFSVYISSDVSWRATNRLRSALTLHILGLDISFHSTHTPGELIERVDGDVDRLANFFSRFVLEILGGILLVVGTLIVLFYEDWRLGAILGVLVTVYLMVHIRSQLISEPYWDVERQTSADLSSFLEERLSGLRDIRANGGIAHVMRRFHEVMRRAVLSKFKADIITDVGWTISNIVFAVSFATVMGLSAYLFQANVITIGTVYLVLHYLQMLHAPLNRIRRQIEDFQMVKVSIRRVRGLMETKPNIQDGPGAVLPSGALSVECENISFSYQPEQPILKNLSFHLSPGKVLGLLGRTGSGKTTLSRLLFRLYDISDGTIYLGDTDIRDLQLSDLRRHTGLVTQEVQLFEASVRDNLTLFNRTIEDDQVLMGLRALELGAWYDTLPDGLDTELPPGGGGLSAGEAQLLAFTRIFLRNPGLIILDEASSRLDPATESHLERAIDTLLRNRTAIIIAHRLSTVQRADEIMILEEGRIREYGEYENLAANPNSILFGLLQTGLEEFLA